MAVSEALAGLGMLQSAFETRTKNRLMLQEAEKERQLKERTAEAENIAAKERAKIAVGPAYSKLAFEKEQDRLAREAAQKAITEVGGTAEAMTAAGRLALGTAEGQPEKLGEVAKLFAAMKPEEIIPQLTSRMSSLPEEHHGPFMKQIVDQTKVYNEMSKTKAFYKSLENYGTSTGKFINETLDSRDPLNAIKNVLEGEAPMRATKATEVLANQLSIIGDRLKMDSPLFPQLVQLQKDYGAKGFSADKFRSGMTDYLTEYMMETVPNFSDSPSSARRAAATFMRRIETTGDSGFFTEDSKGVKKYNGIPIRIDLNEGLAIHGKETTLQPEKKKGSWLGIQKKEAAEVSKGANYYLTPVASVAKE